MNGGEATTTVPTAAQSATNRILDEDLENKVLNEMSLEQIEALQKNLSNLRDQMPAEEATRMWNRLLAEHEKKKTQGAQAPTADAKSTPATASAPEPTTAATPEWKPKDDPHAPPPFMQRMRPLFFLWTMEAIRAGAYEHEIEPGKFETLYRPIDGLILGQVNKGSTDAPVVAIWLYAPTLASDAAGRVREVARGRRVHVVCNEHMRELVPLCDEAGAVHVYIRPIAFETLPDGRVDMTVQILVEPDPAGTGKLRLVSLASILGREAA